jgi:hypothetical protein
VWQEGIAFSECLRSNVTKPAACLDIGELGDTTLPGIVEATQFSFFGRLLFQDALGNHAIDFIRNQLRLELKTSI